MKYDLRRAEEAVEKMVDALYSALPFVEDMAGSERALTALHPEEQKR